MKSSRFLSRSAGKVDEINVSPLIDIVFILLIFFIVTTVFVEETGVEIKRPQAASASMLEKQSILIAITADGQVVWGGQNIGVRGVQGTVRRLLKQQSDQPVIIQVDQEAVVGLYTQVHDEAALAGASRINMATRK